MASTNTPSIPGWEWTELQQLGQAGDLYGLNPIILGSIDQAESSGDPGSPNSSGYGGYFGLGAGQVYPGGSIPGADMGINTPQELAAEAEVAASAFNSYLSEAGGDPIKAEEIFQSGSASGPTEGSQILAANLGVASAGGGGAAPAGGTTAPGGSTSTPATTTSSIWGDLFGGVTSGLEGFFAKILLVAVGAGMLVLAAYKAASPAIKGAGQQAEQLAPLAAA